ncbi:MAG: hypothetical protein ACPGVB_14990 [Chitinophagales bacterium]
MSYSKFTFSRLKEKYKINQQEIRLFKGIEIIPVVPSERLQQDLQEAEEAPLLSEKAKSESIIAPIMRELKRNNYKNITIFSGYTFNIPGENELSGAPDFLISAKARIVEPQSPIFCLLESKNRSAEEGYAQCASEMYAARLFNKKANEPYETIYGAVTNAFEWIFMKLEGDTIYIDFKRYYLVELPKILGILQYIVNQYK